MTVPTAPAGPNDVSAKNQGGRPTDLTQEIADEICERIANGESLRGMCDDDHMPGRSTVFQWLAKAQNRWFVDQYARAREASADADADTISYYAEEIAAGRIDPQAGRAAIDALKWSAGKRAPKKYGDRQTHEHSGPNGAPIPYTDMTAEERRARIAELQERARAADGSGGD